MSEYQQYLTEREKIDFLIKKGCRISAVREHLNGDSVDFIHPNGEGTETLLIGTPNARKYFSVVLMKQKQTQI